jgi:glutathione synthase
MKFLYVMDPVERVNPSGDTTFSFLLESQRRGVENHVCGVEDLFARNELGFANARRVHCSATGTPHARLDDAQPHPFEAFDVIWMRKDPPVDETFLVACMLLERANPQKTLVLNNPMHLRTVHEKLWALAFPDLTPAQLVSADTRLLRAFVDEHGAGVVKPLAFMGGLGVMVFQRGDKNLKSALDLLTQEGRKHVVMQQYLPGVREGDKRILLVDGEAVGGLLRVPQHDDVRANLHVGGTAAKLELTYDDRRIVARLAPELVARGMFFVGLDVIGGKLTEVNVTSPTGVWSANALSKLTGNERVEAVVMDRVFAKCALR